MSEEEAKDSDDRIEERRKAHEDTLDGIALEKAKKIEEV